MELMKNACDPVIPRKRPADESFNDRDGEKFRKQKAVAVRDLPPGCGIIEADRKPLKKIRNSYSNLRKMTLENNNISNTFKCSKPTGKVQFFDPNCAENNGARKPKVTTTVVTQRKPFKYLDYVNANRGMMSKDKSVNCQSLENDKLKRNEPPAASKVKVTNTDVSKGKQLKSLDNVDSNLRKLTSKGDHKLVESKSGRNRPSFGSRSNGIVKKRDLVCSKEGVATTTSNVSQKEHARREEIKDAMKLFDRVNTQLYQENRLKPKGEKIAHWRVPNLAANTVRQMMKWMEPEKSLGPICGVQIGDKFKYRSQLKMIGLHYQPQAGIDYTNIEGKNFALSIVDSHRYSNNSESSDKLVYCGQGGITFLGRKLPPEDQKLERGNLALKNSKDERSPVRVIRKLNELFVYDGLYVVDHFAQKRSKEGKMVFEFHLNRLPGQPPLHQMLNANS